MSILGLKDHFSRDPVQVQSLHNTTEVPFGAMAGGIGPWHCKTQAAKRAKNIFYESDDAFHAKELKVIAAEACVGSCSQANHMLRNSAMDDSIGGS
jgi:hypothetical protein